MRPAVAELSIGAQGHTEYRLFEADVPLTLFGTRRRSAAPACFQGVGDVAFYPSTFTVPF